jgi:site-specific DNA-methyltransferase (adenine-specific)
MPDGIVQNILDAIPNKPNVVYDPFGGSGTTMKVCKQNGIDCIISEIDKEKENTILEKVGEKRKEKDLQAGTLFGNEM